MSDTESLSGDSINNLLEAAAEIGNETKPIAEDDSNASLSINKDYLRHELIEMAQNFHKDEVLNDLVAELIVKEKLNTMVIDLYDYEEGFEVSLHEFGSDEEIFLGSYSYALSLVEYIKDGEIPYELFDRISEYEKFRLFYDGYVFCQLRIKFKNEEFMRSHFVILKHSIQTLIGECVLNCNKDQSLKRQTELARLIQHYSPDLCLDPDPVVADILMFYEYNQYPFVGPYSKYFLQNEKARIEEGIKEMSTTPANKPEPVPTKLENEDWSLKLSQPTQEAIEAAALELNVDMPYLKQRKLCFPDNDFYTGSHVIIETFVYEYDRLTEDGNVDSIRDTLNIAVRDDTECFYGALDTDERMKNYSPFFWFKIGYRDSLDEFIETITIKEARLSSSGVKVIHNRMFGERRELSDGKVKIIRHKLDCPESQVALAKLQRPI